MKSFFDLCPVRVGLSLVAVAGLIATSSCAERKDQAAPAASQVRTDAPAATATAETAGEEVTHVVTSPEDLAKLVTTATSGSGKDRYTAIDDLGERAADVTEVVPELEKNLSDADPQVVWRSVRALGDYGDEAVTAAPALRELLTNSDPILQLHAALALGKVGDKSEETVDALVTAVGSADGRVSRAAVAALKQLKPGPVKVAQALKKAMLAQDNAVVAQAIEAIVELGPLAVPLLNEALKDPTTAYLAAAAAEQIGPDAAGAVPELIAVLGKTKHSQLQIRVILALGHIGAGGEECVAADCVGDEGFSRCDGAGGGGVCVRRDWCDRRGRCAQGGGRFGQAVSGRWSPPGRWRRFIRTMPRSSSRRSTSSTRDSRAMTPRSKGRRKKA